MRPPTVRPLSVLLLVLSCALPLLAGLAAPAGAAPSAPGRHPTIASVRRQLDALAERNAQVVEQFNAARVTVRRREAAARRARTEARRATVAKLRADAEFARAAQARYAAGGLGGGQALLSAHGGSDYLRQLQGLDVIARHEADVVASTERARRAARAAAARAHRMLVAAHRAVTDLQQRRSSVQTQLASYRTTLARLSAEKRAREARARRQAQQRLRRQQQRQQRQQRQQPSPAATTGAPAPQPGPAPSPAPVHHVPAPSGSAQAAVNFALAQLGKPYQWGAAGPGSYDCSGLTMAAWRAGGVSLPHSAADQYNHGTHVSRSQLRPGDLLFFYHPIGHVTIYIGHGKMVSAPTTGQNVQIVPLAYFNSDYVGATRLA